MRRRLIKPLVTLLLISLIVSTAAMIDSVAACQKERAHKCEQKCKCVIDLSAACRRRWMHKHAQERRLVIRSLINLSREISKLPDEAFENPENARCQRKVLRWKVWVVVWLVIVRAYEGAINKLDNDIRGRIEEWVVDPWKTDLIEKVDSIIELIKMLCRDLKPPIIVGVLRCHETPNYDESVTIITSVFDKRSGVESVILSYSVDLNNWVNLTMNPVAGFYVAEIPAQPYDTSVSYKVYAYDKAGNHAVSDAYSYVVIDSHSPVISWVERSPISPNYNDTVSVTASVSEPEEASGVQLVILSYSDGVTWTNMTMTLKEETIYEGMIPAVPSSTTVEYVVYASDNAENWGFSSTYSYTVGAPAPIHEIAIIDVVSSPSIVKVGDAIAINVTVLNEGTMTETFNVSVYYDLTLLETRTLVLGAGAGTTPTFTWVTTSEGVYLIWAEVQRLPGETDVADNIFVDGIVTVSSLQPPVASFTFSPTAPHTGQNVTFDASLSYDPDGTIDSYTWSFGDGTTGNGEIVTHSYADNGTYAVELTVVDNDGLTDVESEGITVLNRPPVASFTESAETVYTNEVIYFNASASYDPDGSIVSYTWGFGDGKITTTSAATINHTYTTPGTYNVTLTVTDDDGLTDDEVKVFTVEAAPWPLSLIVAIILLIVAATATAIYFVRKWKKQGISTSRIEN